ncbi:MAG TPA: heme-binding protein [Gammaproteobacteria bacterium]
MFDNTNLWIRRTDLNRSVARGLGAIAAMSLLLALPRTGTAQLLMQPNISVAQARRIVDAIIEECSQPGDLVTVTVAVVDRAGQPVMQVRADTASPHNWELAFRKAYTARTYRRTSLAWRDRTAGDSALSGQRSLEHVIPLGGGAPIMLGDVPVGGVGVSGAQGGQEADTACAETGIAAIAAELE